MPRQDPDPRTDSLTIRPTGTPAKTTIESLAAIPEEEIWLAKQKSPRTRKAYKLDVQHFLRSLGVTAFEQLRQVDHRAVNDPP